MAQEIKAYKTDDGKIYATREEADKHNFVVSLNYIWCDLNHDGSTYSDFLWFNKDELYKALSPFCAAKHEEDGK